MKCPHCGRWNRASLPRCFYCGETLTEAEDAARQEEQRPSVPVEGPSKVYIQYTEEGQSTPAVDERDQLAAEMKDLLARKRRGEIQHRRLRENSARQGFAPTGRTAQTLSGRSPFPYPDAYPEGEEREVGGSVRDVSGSLRYGGRTRKGVLIEPDATIPVPCRFLDGHLVLVPRACFQTLGFIDTRFLRVMGDYDYSNKAFKAGVPRLVAPGTLAQTARSFSVPVWKDPQYSLVERIYSFFYRK